MSFARLPVKRLGDVLLGKMIQPEPKGASDVRAPYLRAAHVQPYGIIIDADEKTMWFQPGELAKHDLQRGDVIIVEGGAGFGRSATIRDDRRGWGFQNSIIRIRPCEHVAVGRFLDYALQAALQAGEIEVACYTATIPHFTAEKIGAFPVPAPPVACQQAIADYLDRETAKIDTLIEEQQRLIDLLRERRDTVIRNSTGWGTYLPDHWTSQRLSWLFQSTASGTTPDADQLLEPTHSSIPWVTTSELREERVMTTRTAVIPEAVETYSSLRIHPVGSLLIAMYGATIGRMAILGVEATSNQACCALIGPLRAIPDFVQYSLFASREWLLLDAAGGGQPNINQDKVRSFRIPVPPLEEQQRIVADLDEQTAKIDALIAEAERFIELAKERRSVLITAAVTGQINVLEDSR